jgi:hypothetical protein
LRQLLCGVLGFPSLGNLWGLQIKNKKKLQFICWNARVQYVKFWPAKKCKFLTIFSNNNRMFPTNLYILYMCLKHIKSSTQLLYSRWIRCNSHRLMSILRKRGQNRHPGGFRRSLYNEESTSTLNFWIFGTCTQCLMLRNF